MLLSNVVMHMSNIAHKMRNEALRYDNAILVCVRRRMWVTL